MLFVHASDEGYGADRILLAMATDVHRRGGRAAVLVPDDQSRGWLTDQLEMAGVSVRRIGLAPARRRYLRPRHLLRYGLEVIRAARRVRSAARDMRAVVVHVNTTTILAAALVGRPGGARLIWHIHEIVVSPLPLALVMRACPALVATRVIAVSEAVARHLVAPGRLRRRIAVIRNGIPDRPERSAVAANPVPLVVFVGRLNRWKGYEVLLDALADLNRRRPGTFGIAIAGAPPPGEEWRATDLQHRLEEAGLAGRSEVLGQLDDPISLLDRADIVVAPSTLPDPFPTVILEAMRSARAIVASDHGGAREMLDDGSSGILVPPGDPKALADAIEQLIDDPGLRTALGSHARARFEQEFREDRFLAAVEALHRDLSRKAAR